MTILLGVLLFIAMTAAGAVLFSAGKLLAMLLLLVPFQLKWLGRNDEEANALYERLTGPLSAGLLFAGGVVLSSLHPFWR